MHVTFFDMPVSELAEALFQRAQERKNMWNMPDKVIKQAVNGSLASKLDLLPPLVIGVGLMRTLLTQTSSRWTACFTNRYGVAAGDSSQTSYLTQELKIRRLDVSYVEDSPKGQPGSTQFALDDWRSGKQEFRYVYAHKETRWEFGEQGERYPFEEVENYTARKIKGARLDLFPTFQIISAASPALLPAQPNLRTAHAAFRAAWPHASGLSRPRSLHESVNFPTAGSG